MNSLLDVLTGTYITPTRRRALQDVNVKHSDLLAGVIISRAGGIRTHDLLNPIQAHYQAVLRPDLGRLFTLRSVIANELFLPIIPSEVEAVTARPREARLSIPRQYLRLSPGEPSTPLRSTQDDRRSAPLRMRW
jgi:hypothetical protein